MISAPSSVMHMIASQVFFSGVLPMILKTSSRLDVNLGLCKALREGVLQLLAGRSVMHLRERFYDLAFREVDVLEGVAK